MLQNLYKEMDKETLLKELKKRLGEPTANGFLGDTGISGRTLEKYVDAILPTIKADATPDSAFYDAHAEVAKAMGGQMRFEQAEFIKNHKSGDAPKNQNGKQETGTEGKTDGNEELIGKLKERLDTLEKAQKDKEKELLCERMRSSIRNKAGELKVSNKNLWEDSVNSLTPEEGMGPEDFEKKAKEVYESRLKRYSGDGATPYSGNEGHGAGAGADAAKALDAFFERKAAEGKFPSKNQ